MSEQFTEVARQQGDLWSEAGRDWAELIAPTIAPVWSACLDCARVTRGSRLLDVGCGSGETLALARFRGAEVAGIDPAADFLEIARRRVPDADLRLGDMEALPYEDDSFDAVTLVNSIMYAQDERRALREARRVLDQDGRLAVAVWTDPDECDFRHVMMALRDVLTDPPQGAGPFALAEPGALEDLLEASGLDPVEERTVPTPWSFVDRDHYVRAIVGTGPGQGVLREVGVGTVVEALDAVGERFRRDDGSYLLHNAFRVVAATPRNDHQE